MRILVISLLKLGDLVLIVPALRQLKRQHPDAQLHLVVNSEFTIIKSLLPFVDKFHFFPHKDLQKSLISTDRPSLEAFDLLGEYLDRMNQEPFDRVINLTHTELSGLIAGAIRSKEYNGLCLKPSSPTYFGSIWFRYLNKMMANDEKNSLHFSDIFYFACGGTGQRDIQLLDKKNNLRKFLSNKIAIQALTSDEKKNWSLHQWGEMLKIFHRLSPGQGYIVLAAPNEEALLSSFVDELNNSGLSVELSVCSLEEAYRILDECDLLLTGDTSIKHMAAATSCRVAEISLGHSDYKHTGYYGDGGLIIQSYINCTSGSHTEPYLQSRQECSLDLDPNCKISSK